MKIDDFLSRLKGVQASGDRKWVACCPAHEDDSPSLGIALGADDRILVNCYAGCSFDEIVSAMGLKKSDLMPDNGKATPAKKKAKKAVAAKKDIRPSFAPKKDYGTLVESYDYQDEAGTVIFRVDRRKLKSGKKTFIQKHADPNSPYGWSYGVSSAGVNKIPFRLPRIIAAAKSGKNVVVLEGEKDVLAIEKRLGVVATCNPGGAGKWLAGWGKYFVGCKGVLIVADKDPMTKIDKKTGEEKPFAVGQRHACDIEAKLRADGFAGQIRKVCLPDVAGKSVKDFSDWVEAMDTAGNKVDKSAFQTAIAQFGEWPQEWAFDGADLDDLSRAQKNARVSASSTPSGAVEEARAVDGEESEAQGERRQARFGRPVPRAPGGSVKAWLVDFDVDSTHSVTLTVSCEESIRWGIAKAIHSVLEICPDNEMPKGVLPRLKTWVVATWLLARGSFFWNNEKKEFKYCMYLDRDPKSCVLMQIESDEFYTFVAHHAELDDIDPKKGDLKRIIGLVKQIAMSEEYSIGVTPSNMWDRRGDAVYISNGDANMYRLTGGKVDAVQNGTDGVLFLRGKTLAPWKLVDGSGIDPFENAKIFSGASWSDKTGRMNIRLWVLNLFACHATKPLLLITGGAGSGKTRMAKAVKEILGVRTDGRLDLSVQQVEDGDKGLDAFWATVNDGKLEVFDNLDTKVKWVSDTLQNVSTDGQTKRRTLYTTFGVSILRANANIILTSNNPLFSTEGNGGMADRLISIHLDLNRAASMDTELSQDIRDNRDSFLTWIARTVALALADTGEVDQSINRRHPDYGRFSVRCGRAFGGEQSVVEALGAAEADKSLLPLKNDMITKEILRVLERRNWSMRFTGGEMADAIVNSMGDDADEKTRTMYGSRRVGKALSKYLRQFGAIFNMNPPRLVEGRTVYEVTGLTAAGRLIMLKNDDSKAEPVGSVGLKPTFPINSHTHNGRGGFSENGDINPPNPPHARARPLSTPSQEEEGIGIKEPTELTEGDDFVF